MPVEEGQKQYAYMRAVHVRIRHADYLVVAELALVKLGVYACAESGYHGAYLVVGKHFIQAGLFHVEYLAAKGQYCLKLRVAAHLGGAACGVALH